MASPAADMLTLMGEFGWVGAALYAGFMLWVLWGLGRKASRAPPGSGGNLVCLVMVGGTLFLNMTMLFAATCTVHPVVYPWWMLIGCLWNMPLRDSDDSESPEGLSGTASAQDDWKPAAPLIP